jgi:hypothetical protein
MAEMSWDVLVGVLAADDCRCEDGVGGGETSCDGK